MARRQYGAAGHLIVADACRFHLHTHIGKWWCISTVGEYYPTGSDKMETVGSGRFYETMVFNLRSRKTRWQEQDFGGYNKRDAAEAGHEALCQKYEAL